MNRNRIAVPRGLTPEEGYALLMRHGAYYSAARLARDYDLGKALVIEAAFKAFCRFDDLGCTEEALIVAEEFGFTTYVASLAEIGEAATAAQLLRLPDLPTPSRRPGSELPN